MAKASRRPAPPRLAWPEWSLLVAPPVPLDRVYARTGIVPFWGVSWRRWGGHVGLSPMRRPTDFPYCDPLRILVQAPTDCDDIWASLIVKGMSVRQPCSVSPVTIVPADRHDPARGLYYPPAFPYLTLGG